MSRVAFLLLFVLITFADLYQVWTGGAYRIVTKPLIMASLIVYYTVIMPHFQRDKPRIIFLVALLAALAGDVFLLWDNMFAAGLGSFLVMQLCYSHCFWKERQKDREVYLYAFLLLVVIGGVAFVLWPELGSLRNPVLIYMTAIASMSYTALGRERSLRGYSWVFAGTLLFMVSDTALALHEFSDQVNLGKLTVMITYALAQYVIVQGFIDGALRD